MTSPASSPTARLVVLAATAVLLAGCVRGAASTTACPAFVQRQADGFLPCDRAMSRPATSRATLPGSGATVSFTHRVRVRYAAVTITTTYVVIVPGKQRSQPIPDELRARLETELDAGTPV